MKDEQKALTLFGNTLQDMAAQDAKSAQDRDFKTAKDGSKLIPLLARLPVR